jgi:hypothetical protein
MKSFTRLSYLVFAVTLVLLVPAASKAQLLFTAGNVSAVSGGAGSLDLTLTNSGPDLNLGGIAVQVVLTNNPALDVTLDQSFIGSHGQSFQYLTQSPFFIATGQTITLEKVGFHVAPGATANTVGVALPDPLGRQLNLLPIPGTGVNGSITVLGHPLVFSAENVTVSPGGSGSFALTLKNIGPDLDLAAWGGNLLLTNNPAFDVTLDNASPGSLGQFLPFGPGNSQLSIAAGQTINLGNVGFHVLPGATANIVGVTFANAFGIKFGTTQNIPTTGVNGSITVLGQSSVPEPGAVALLAGLAIPGAALLLRRRRR